MNGRAFWWSLANMVLLYLFGAFVGFGLLHGSAAFLVGISVGMISYQFGKQMIRAGMLS